MKAEVSPRTLPELFDHIKQLERERDALKMFAGIAQLEVDPQEWAREHPTSKQYWTETADGVFLWFVEPSGEMILNRFFPVTLGMRVRDRERERTGTLVKWGRSGYVKPPTINPWYCYVKWDDKPDLTLTQTTYLLPEGAVLIDAT